ncbi:MAG: helix-turn-helix domain-containing protein [Clostridia bacterium]|nr:helix-turn-helix domain-containing protein [Clostridia bacterium]
MSILFAETLRKLRTEHGLSQRELSDLVYVTRSTITRWENGTRLPDAAMISRLSQCLNVDVNTLLSTVTVPDEAPHVIMVDDRKIILSGGLPILQKAMPYAIIEGFTRPSEAIEYANSHRVSLAFLDIELGNSSGLDLCRKLLEIYPRTNVVYLTSFVRYSFDAWSTGASGFMLKPISEEGVQAQLKSLRYPFFSGGANQ